MHYPIYVLFSKTSFRFLGGSMYQILMVSILFLLACGEDLQKGQLADQQGLWSPASKVDQAFELNAIPQSLEIDEKRKAQDFAAIAIKHPLGKTRFIFISKIDGKVWGIECPEKLEAYKNKTLDEILKCGYEIALGPVNIRDFFQKIPFDLDERQLEADLRFGFNQPALTIRDKYYDLWDVLFDLACEDIKSSKDSQGQHHSLNECPHLEAHTRPVIVINRPPVTGGDVVERPASKFSFMINGSNVNLTLRCSYDQPSKGHPYVYDGSNVREDLKINCRDNVLISITGSNGNIKISEKLRNNTVIHRNGSNLRVSYF